MTDQAFPRRALMGWKVQLRNGGWLRLRPRVDNLAYQEKMRRLDVEIRSEKGISPDANLWEVLDEREYLTMLHRAQLGTVIMEWGGFDDENGNEVGCYITIGDRRVLDEETGVMILLSAGVGNDFLDAIEPLDKNHRRHREVIEKNSSEPSVGTSATEGSLTPIAN